MQYAWLVQAGSCYVLYISGPKWPSSCLTLIRDGAKIYIQYLPEVVLGRIADFLAPEEVVQLARTCKRLYSILPRFVVMCGKDFHINGPPVSNWAPERIIDGPPLPAPVKNRAGGTGPTAPVLAGPIFEAPIIHFKLKPKQVFRVKKTRGAPMGRPKLELHASNGVHICHAI